MDTTVAFEDDCFDGNEPKQLALLGSDEENVHPQIRRFSCMAAQSR
jgi:hypothetical protein